MTLEELRVEKVTFGKAHVGKTFQELPTEIKCLTWFTETFRHSRKPEHAKLLRFVQLHLESLEMEDPVVPTCSDPGCETQIAPGPQLLSAQIKAKVLVGWAKEKKAIAVDVHELILKFSDLSCEAVIQS